MTIFKTEAEAFKAAEAKIADLNRGGMQYGLRILKTEHTTYNGFKALIVPAQVKWMSDVLPFYL